MFFYGIISSPGRFSSVFFRTPFPFVPLWKNGRRDNNYYFAPCPLTLTRVPVPRSVLGFRVKVLVRVVHGRHVHGQVLRRFAPAARPQRAGRRRLGGQIRRGRMTSDVPADLFALLRVYCNTT